MPRGIYSNIFCNEEKNETPFVPTEHQKDTLEYFMNSNKRGLLLYHKLGSGKTCTATMIADKMLEEKRIEKVFIFSPGSLRKGWITEYCKLCGKSADFLYENFTFITYNYSVGERLPNLDKSLIIIDEVHNLINGTKNESKNPTLIYNAINRSQDSKILALSGTVLYNYVEEFYLLGKLLNPEPFLKIHSGRGFIEALGITPGPEGGMIVKNKSRADELFTGIISYYPGAGHEFVPEVIEMPPIRVAMSPKQAEQYFQWEYIEAMMRSIVPIRAEFESNAEFELAKRLHIMALKYILSRRISNFDYGIVDSGMTQGTELELLKMRMDNKSATSKEIAQKVLERQEAEKKGETIDLLPEAEALDLGDFTFNESDIKIPFGLGSKTSTEEVLNDDDIDEKHNSATLKETPKETPKDDEKLDIGDIGKIDLSDIDLSSLKSPKITDRVVEKIASTAELAVHEPEVKTEKGETAEPQEIFKRKKDLPKELKGWIEKSKMENKFLLNASPKLCALFINIIAHNLQKHVVFTFFKNKSGVLLIKYLLQMCGIKSSVFSGDLTDVDRGRLLRRFNSPENMYGDKLRILLVTEAGAEGISILEARHMHIFESSPRMSKTIQAIGRVARFRSHINLPEEERNIKIWRYWSVAPPEPVTIDIIKPGPKKGEKITVKKTYDSASKCVDEYLYDKGKEVVKYNDDFLNLLKGYSVTKWSPPSVKPSILDSA